MRIAVVGTSGSGKTTLAAALAAKLGIAHIELDALHWGPDWTSAPKDVFRARTREAVAQEAWTCDGNYSAVRDIVWERATHVVFLDYRFPLVFARAVRRTFRRWATREELFAGNVETLDWFDPEWIPWWVVRTHRRNRRRYAELFARPESARLDVRVFRTPRETERFLTDASRESLGGRD